MMAFIRFFLCLFLLTLSWQTQAQYSYSKPKVKANGKAKPSASSSLDTWTPSPLPTPAPPPPSAVSLTDRHFFVAGIYSSANQINYKGQLNLFGTTPTDYSAVENTSGAAGLRLGYLHRREFWFGYGGDLTYEMSRSSSGVVGHGGNLTVKGTYDGSPSNSLVAAAANANFSIGSRFYFLAGVNYPLAFGGGSGQSYTGLIGYQEGAGFTFTDRLSCELSYRVLRMKGSINSSGLNISVDEATFPGFILALHYMF
jgi:opacity protein-like surface antigen